MAEMKERFAMSLGFTLHSQKIDTETNAVMIENFVNVWGGRYERLEPEEAVLFQAALNAACGSELDVLAKKAREVGVKFGLELVGHEPTKPGRPG
jgi:hypothetical protein